MAASAGRSYPLSVIISAVDKITGPIKRMTSSLGGLGSKVQGVGKTLNNLGDRAGIPMLARSFGQVSSAAGALASRVGAIGKRIAATAAIGIAATGALANAYADTTGAIGDLANRTGASRERIQELGYAAKLSGSSSEALASALQKMNVNIGAAKGGSTALKDIFDGLQVSFENTNGTAKSTDEIFNQIVNRLSRIKDPALQAKAAVTIFGKSATELLPLLQGGTKGLAEMSAEARKLGVVIADKAVREGEEFGDVLDRLKASVTGAGYTIGAALTPALTDLATQLTETIVKYRPEIKKFALEFAGNLPTYIKDARKALADVGDTLSGLAKGVKWCTDNFGLMKTILYGLATVITASVIAPVITLTTAVWGLGAALLATPIGWFIAAVAGLAAMALIVYKNWDNIGAFFTDKFNAVKEAFDKGIIQGLWSLWKEFNPVTLILESINGLVKYLTGVDIGSIIKSKLAGVVPGFGDAPAGPDPTYTALPQGGAAATAVNNAKAAITVDFRNMPQGTDVSTNASRGAGVSVNQGYSMMPIK